MRNCIDSVPPRRSSAAGLTLMELLLVVAILAVLAAMMVPMYGYFRRKAEDAVCMANLRTLHAALSSYMGDNGQIWPQNPNPDAETDDSAEAKWWYDTLKSYGPTRKTWLCPSHTVDSATENDPQNYDFSYIPTNFGPEPNVAYKWKQPWVIEFGGYHDGNMANQVMPDGSLRKVQSPSAK